jgi:pyruvate-formate lyase-activating enzyme
MDYVDTKPIPINERNLGKALRLAEIGNVTTVIITGKGEPMLFPQHIGLYMDRLKEYRFPFIELQTNGSILDMETFAGQDVDRMLAFWAACGLTTILISNVGYDDYKNNMVYFPHKKSWIDIKKVVDKVQKHGINIRLTTVGINGGIDSPNELVKLLGWAGALGVKQVTWRPVAKPSGNGSDVGVSDWVKANGLTQDQVQKVAEYVVSNGTLLYKLVHGAAVYDLLGKNFCLGNCLTNDPTEETIRQLIFYPDGGLYTDWQFKGSVLL